MSRTDAGHGRTKRCVNCTQFPIRFPRRGAFEEVSYDLWTLSRTDGTARDLVTNAVLARITHTRHLVFLRDNVMLGARFDPKTMEFRGSGLRVALDGNPPVKIDQLLPPVALRVFGGRQAVDQLVQLLRIGQGHVEVYAGLPPLGWKTLPIGFPVWFLSEPATETRKTAVLRRKFPYYRGGAISSVG